MDARHVRFCSVLIQYVAQSISTTKDRKKHWKEFSHFRRMFPRKSVYDVVYSLSTYARHAAREDFLEAVMLDHPSPIPHTHSITPTTTTTSDTQSNISIWDGLWAGSNFDFGSFRFNNPILDVPDSTSSAPTSAGAITNAPTGASTTPAAPVVSPKIYAALGDSVAAGLGLPGVPQPVGSDARCGRSSQAYPNIVAGAMNLSLLHTACSGALQVDLSIFGMD